VRPQPADRRRCQKRPRRAGCHERGKDFLMSPRSRHCSRRSSVAGAGSRPSVGADALSAQTAGERGDRPVSDAMTMPRSGELGRPVIVVVIALWMVEPAINQPDSRYGRRAGRPHGRNPARARASHRARGDRMLCQNAQLRDHWAAFGRPLDRLVSIRVNPASVRWSDPSE
jgi:hypothetical protein